VQTDSGLRREKRKTTRSAAVGLFRSFQEATLTVCCVAWEERRADLCGRLAHRELPAATDLAALTALEHLPVDAVRRRHVLVADLGSNVVLVGARGEQGRDAGVPQRVGRDLLADWRRPAPKMDWTATAVVEDRWIVGVHAQRGGFDPERAASRWC
jgi:hypothetical protein